MLSIIEDGDASTVSTYDDSYQQLTTHSSQINLYEVHDDAIQLQVLLDNLMVSYANDEIFVLFTASKDPDTGKSWLHDCDRAYPLIQSVLSQLEAPVHLIVFTIPIEQFRNPEYFLRQDPKISLRTVPTLTKWRHQECILQLNKVHCQNVILLEEILLEAIAD